MTHAHLRNPCLPHTLHSNINYGNIVNDKVTVTRRNLFRLVALRVNVLEEENIKERLTELAVNRRSSQPSSPTCSIFTPLSQYHECIYKLSVITNLLLQKTYKLCRMTSQEVNFLYCSRRSKAVEIIAALIPQILQFLVQIMSANVGWCHNSGDCSKWSAHISVCFCSRSGASASIRLLT